MSAQSSSEVLATSPVRVILPLAGITEGVIEVRVTESGVTSDSGSSAVRRAGRVAETGPPAGPGIVAAAPPVAGAVTVTDADAGATLPRERLPASRAAAATARPRATGANARDVRRAWLTVAMLSSRMPVTGQAGPCGRVGGEDPGTP